MKTSKNHPATFTPIFAGEPAHKDNGANNHFADFAPIANFLLDSYSSFSLRDAIILSRAADMPYSEVERHFNDFTRKLVRQGKIKEVNNGCYDGGPVFVVQTV